MEKILRKSLVKVIRPSAFVNCCLSKLNFYSPTETGKWGIIILDNYISKECLRNTFLCCKTNKRPGEHFHLKEAQKICNYKFSNLKILKAKSGASSQEETCLKFSQAEGNVKVVLVSTEASAELHSHFCTSPQLSPSQHIHCHRSSRIDL